MTVRASLQQYGRGPLVVATGSVALGVGSYVFLTLAARSLGPTEFGELSALWAVLFGVVAGLWYPFEQEAARLVASAAGFVGRADLRRVAVVQSAALVVAETVVLAVAVTSSSVRGVAVALAVSVATLGLAGLQRGVLVGASRFGWVSAQLLADGVTRVVGAVTCVVTGAGIAAFAVVLALAPLVGVLVALPGTPRRNHEGGITRSWGVVLRDLAALIAGSSLAIALLNVGPLIVRGISDADATGRFMAVFVIARLPLFFSGAIVSGLLPSLVASHDEGDPRRYRRSVQRLVGAVAAVVMPACLVLGLVGPWAARTFFGSAYDASIGSSVLLALSSGLLLLGLVLQASLVAAGRTPAVALGWAAGAVALGLALALPLDPVLRVSFAYLVSGVVVVASMLVSLGRGRASDAG